MKVYFLILLFCFLCSQLYSQSNTGYTIKGRVAGISEGAIFYLVRDNNGEADTVSKARADKEGVFAFKEGYLNREGEFYWIRPDEKPGNNLKPLPILLENTNISISGNFNGWPDLITVHGSKSNDDYILVNNLIRQPKNEMDRINNKIEELYKSVNYSLIGFDSLKKQEYFNTKFKLDSLYKVNEKEYNQKMIQFLYDYPNSIYTPALALEIMSLLNEKELLKVFENLSNSAKESFYGNELSILIRNINRLKIGMYVPDFIIQNLSNDQIPVTNILSKSKITLIDFWASWCGPCRKEIPKLKKLYKQFRSKGFNILSISIDKSKNDWLKAIKEEKMPWPQGISLEAKKLFDIKGIPAYVLLDGHGKILDYHMVLSRVENGQGSFFMDKNKLELKLKEVLH